MGFLSGFLLGILITTIVFVIHEHYGKYIIAHISRRINMKLNEKNQKISK